MVIELGQARINSHKYGTAAIVSGLLWVAVAALFGLAEISESRSGVFGDAERTVWGVMTVAIVTAGVLVVTVLIGLRRRLDLGRGGMVGIVLAGLGSAAGIMSWAFPVWGGLLGVGMSIFGVALIRGSEAPRPAAAAFGFGMLSGIVTFIVLDLMKVGPTNSYGDHPVAWAAGLTTMMLVSAFGLIGIGRWLRTG